MLQKWHAFIKIVVIVIVLKKLNIVPNEENEKMLKNMHSFLVFKKKNKLKKKKI